MHLIEKLSDLLKGPLCETQNVVYTFFDVFDVKFEALLLAWCLSWATEYKNSVT